MLKRPPLSVFVAVLAALLAAADSPSLAQPQTVSAPSAIMERLNGEQQRVYQDWLRGYSAHEQALERYWTFVDAKKAERKAKRGAGQPITPADYVGPHPPKYAGPALRADIAAIKASLEPPASETALPVIAEYVAMARQHFEFQPLATTEQEFKRRYAIEALRQGLTKDQVLRVYALETGGRGTYDMQSGIDPDTRKGKAISSAVGYAQLLHGNSVSELVTHGELFAARLNALSVTPGVDRARAQQLIAKAQTLRAMLRVARSVRPEWGEHVKLGGSPRGMGIHALNLDADVGPWLQVLKLAGLRTLAAKSGRPQLTGAEIELMNLAGPRTGLEMMEPVALGASTANFFSQQGFYRNTIVREKSSAELLAALEQRMNANLVKPGAIEFAQIFDEVAASGVAVVAAADAAVVAPRPVPVPVLASRARREAVTPADTGRLHGFAVFEPR